MVRKIEDEVDVEQTSVDVNLEGQLPFTVVAVGDIEK